MEKIVSGSIADFRSTMRVFLSFAATAVILAAIGIYGLMSYWVSQRTFDIGLRVAVGASRQQIVAMIVRQGLKISSYGVIAGICAALLLTRFLASLLYGVGTTDAFTFGAVTALIFGVAAIATAVPAWRASLIDPAKSLRVE
jgi:ABC-type antimicrobial peptide transport system permease subunit